MQENDKQSIVKNKNVASDLITWLLSRCCCVILSVFLSNALTFPWEKSGRLFF